MRIFRGFELLSCEFASDQRLENEVRGERPSDRTLRSPTIETIVFARDLGIIKGKIVPSNCPHTFRNRLFLYC